MSLFKSLAVNVTVAAIGACVQAEPVLPTHSMLESVQHYLVISSTVAHVTDMSLSTAPAMPEYILIQDIHKHPEVQTHIASLIMQGYGQWGVKKVFLEGAFTGVDLSMFHRLPKPTQLALLDRLVQEGDLSGPELATVLLTDTEWSNPRISPYQLIGMEDAKLYRQNIAAYDDVLAHRDEALEELKSIRRLQSAMNLPELNALTQQLDRTEALIRLKLTPGEYEEYKRAKLMTPSSPRLDPAIRAAQKFYVLVQRRSGVFLREVQKKVPASPGPRVLVVGGFHTPAMAEALRREGHTFIVLTPHVTEAGDETLYEKRMMESVSALQVPDHLNH